MENFASRWAKISGNLIINWLSTMQNIVPKRLYNALTFAQPIPFAAISLDNIPLQVRVDNSPLNAREKVDIAIIMFFFFVLHPNLTILGCLLNVGLYLIYVCLWS